MPENSDSHATIHAAILEILEAESPLFAMDILHRLQARGLHVSRRTFGTTIAEHLREHAAFAQAPERMIGDACAWRLACVIESQWTPDWELFEGKGSPQREPGEFALTSHRQWAYLSAGGRKQLGNPSRIVWLYTKERTHIALRAAEEPAKSLALSKNGGIAWGSLLNCLDIEIPAGTKLRGEWDAKRAILAFALPPKTGTNAT